MIVAFPTSAFDGDYCDGNSKEIKQENNRDSYDGRLNDGIFSNEKEKNRQHSPNAVPLI